MKKVVITGIVVIAALAGIMYVLNKNKATADMQTQIVAEKNASVMVRVEPVEFKEVNGQYIANGVFMPKQDVKISTETPGVVSKVYVSEGSFVKAGQILAVVKSDKQNVGVSNAQAVFNNAKAEVARFESAYATGGVTKQQLDNIKLQLVNAKNNLENAKITASDVNITASFSGIVNKKNIEPGSYVNPGQEVFEIVNVSTLKLRVNVDEKNVGSLKIGQAVKVESPVLAGKSFTGKITFIAPKADASLNFPVDLEIQNNPDNELRAGMYGNAYFGDSQMANVLVVSRNAFVGSVSSNEVYVYRDGKAYLTKVTIGRTYGDFVEVTSGLKAGEQVIVSGQINLVNETVVEIIK